MFTSAPSDPYSRTEPTTTDVTVSEHRNSFGHYVAVTLPSGVEWSLAVEDGTVDIRNCPSEFIDEVQATLQQRGYRTIPDGG